MLTPLGSLQLYFCKQLLNQSFDGTVHFCREIQENLCFANHIAYRTEATACVGRFTSVDSSEIVITDLDCFSTAVKAIDCQIKCHFKICFFLHSRTSRWNDQQCQFGLFLCSVNSCETNTHLVPQVKIRVSAVSSVPQGDKCSSRPRNEQFIKQLIYIFIECLLPASADMILTE